MIVNDRPDLVTAAGADGVHVGQDDMTVDRARALVGRDRIVGLSTHTPAQVDAAAAEPEIDYIGVGPVHATPTKPGRPAVGLDLVRYAAAHAATPFFAIGGIDAGNAPDVRAAGAAAIAVVRAITDARDPESAARALLPSGKRQALAQRSRKRGRRGPAKATPAAKPVRAEAAPAQATATEPPKPKRPSGWSAAHRGGAHPQPKTRRRGARQPEAAGPRRAPAGHPWSPRCSPPRWAWRT